MKLRMCENCIKHKTIYCPNSDECLSREDKPFYEDKYTILTKVEALDETLKDCIEELQTLKIQISAREEICNRLENNWNKLKEYCKENTLCYEVGDDENTKLIGSRIHGLNVLDKMQELEQGSDKK